LKAFTHTIDEPVSQETLMSNALQSFLEAVATGDDVRAEETALTLTCEGDAVVPALRELLADTDADRRWWAVRGLAAVGTQAAREPLITALSDADPYVRACAAQGLGELHAEDAIDRLAQCLADSSPLVSRVAADSLARIGPSAVQTLIAALQEKEVMTRAGAARALSIIQPEEAIPALCAALNDPSAIVTHYAEEALEQMGVGMVFIRF
jgi:HEAT repeat protein